MSRHSGSLPPAYFDAKYAADADPWQFATSPYEDGKYTATLAALPNRFYSDVLEVGCSIGVLTERLAARSGRLLAVDVAEAALEQARARCAHLPQVAFARCIVPQDWPHEPFDLIVLSEVVYYLDSPDVARLAGRLSDSLRPGGHIVLVHWTGETDYPLSGDEAVELLLHHLRERSSVLQVDRTDRYRLDVLRLD